jgi:hypothetical protein
MAFTEFKQDYMEATFEDICKWCKENQQGKWLKNIITEEIEKPVYPTIKKINSKGKEVEVIDKKAKEAKQSIGTTKERRSYIEIKREFFKEFHPAKLPQAKKDKSTPMEDLFAEIFGADFE